MFTKIRVILFVLAAGVIQQANAVPGPQDFLEKFAKPTEVLNSIKNRQYEMITGTQDSERREEGKKKIRFLVRNWRNESWDILKKNFKKLPSHWVNGGAVKVIIHGWNNLEMEAKTKVDHMKVLNNQALDICHTYANKNISLNTVAVDWVDLSTESSARYEFVVENTKVVGQVVAEFLLNLAKLEVKNPKRLHLIGHGVGAHVAGVAGKIFYDEYSKRLGRITGLDPFGPGYDDADSGKRKDVSMALTKNDALFVDAIHCTGPTTNIFVGMAQGIYGSHIDAGHIDFFPNSGEEQPGCKKIEDQRAKHACSSKKCITYFIASIEGVEYFACPCNSKEDFESGSCGCDKKTETELMGDPVSHSARGRYYLKIGEDNRGIFTKYA